MSTLEIIIFMKMSYKGTIFFVLNVQDIISCNHESCIFVKSGIFKDWK